jgi:hypothetical protein
MAPWALIAALLLSDAAPAAEPCSALVARARVSFVRAPDHVKGLLDQAEQVLAQEPTCTSAYFSARGELLRRGKDPRGAAKAFRRAAHAALDRASFRALTSARISALTEAKATQTPALLREVLQAEEQLAAMDRAPTAAHGPRIPALEAVFAKDHDRARVAHAKAVSARILAQKAATAEQVPALAEPIARDVALPSYVRLSALEALVSRAIVAQDLPEEVALTARIDALKNAKLAPAARRYARSARLERACARLEKVEPPGSCVRLARRETGEWMFFDWSKKPPQKTLSDEDIDRAGRQYVPALEACLRQAVVDHPDDERFLGGDLRLSWSIGADGRTRAVEIEPRRYDEPLGPCVRAEIASFRYPRATDGQARTALLPFHLDVKDRTPRRP